MFSKTWSDGLLIRELTVEEHKTHIIPAHEKVFAGRPAFMADSIYSKEETQKLETLRADFDKAIYRLRLGAFWNNEFCGWHFGRQEAIDTYCMTNSGVLPEFRRRKIYERLLEATNEVVAKKGFQCITSQHHPSNNAVIIPKLKQGFCIAGMEVKDSFGTLVLLKKFMNPKRNEVFEFRTGYTLPSEFIKTNVLKNS